MNWSKIDKAWRIWGFPVAVYWCAVLILPSIAEYARGTGRYSREIYAYILTYGNGGILLLTWWIIMRRYQKIEGKPVRKETKFYWKLLLIICIVSAVTAIILRCASYYYSGQVR